VLFAALASASASAGPAKPPKPPKVHTAILGGKLRVTWLPSSTTENVSAVAVSTASPTGRAISAQRLSITIRPLLIDGRRKEWTTGPAHDVTDHTFAILQALHINDALPTDKSSHFVWQTGTWLLVDRTTGHITPLHITALDPALTGISWYRDLAAYCAVSPSGKTLSAEVFEIGTRKAAARKRIAAWPLPAAPEATSASPANSAPDAAIDPTTRNPLAPAVRPRPRVPSIAASLQLQDTGLPHPVLCNTFEWQRDPMRVVITPRADLPPVSLDLNSTAGDGTVESGSSRSRHPHDDAAAAVDIPAATALGETVPAPANTPATAVPPAAPEKAPEPTPPEPHPQPRSQL
jgi:hypothetical protein